MFYGAKLLPGRSVEPTDRDGGEILHISQVCLVDPTDNSPTYLQVESEGKSYCVCALQKGKEESMTTDLFVSTQQNLRLSTKGGKNEVHVVGYFEPEAPDHDDDDEDLDDEEEAALMRGRMRELGAGDDEDDDEDSILDDEDDDQDDDDEVDEDGTPKIEEVTDEKEAMKNVLKRLPPTGVRGKGRDAEEDEEDDEDDDDDEEDDEENDDAKAVMKNGAGKRPAGQQQQKGQQQPNKKAKTTTNAQQGGKAAANGTAAPKKKGAAGGAGDKEAFKQQLVDYLKKNGRTALGALGQKVKKPPSIADKLGKFLKENSGTFKIENGFVSV